MSTETIKTPLLKLFGIKYPIILAGMSGASGPKLCAAVSNAGGLGVFGGINYGPRMLKKKIQQVKKGLDHPDLPWGVDLLLPKVGEGARATNVDYTKGKLGELLDIIIAAKASLFVSAVGVPPVWAVEKLHKAGIPVMNMIGSPRHVKYALDAGVDLICAQGGEGGGHTGEVATTILIPEVVDLCKDHTSPLTGDPVWVIAAGGIFDGRGMAMALSLGAQAVWVGTRFVCSKEAGATKDHQAAVLSATVHDTIRTLVYTGRPLRIRTNPYAKLWEKSRRNEMNKLLAKGIIPYKNDLDRFNKAGKKKGKKRASTLPQGAFKTAYPHLLGQCAGVIDDIKPAKEIVQEMMIGCVETFKRNAGRIQSISKL